MNTRDLTNLAVLGIGGVILYAIIKKGSQAIDYTSSTLADIWLSLTLPPTMQLLGNIVMPDGSLLPLQGADVRLYPNGDTLLQLDGHFYKLSPSNADGNWPATQVP